MRVQVESILPVNSPPPWAHSREAIGYDIDEGLRRLDGGSTSAAVKPSSSARACTQESQKLEQEAEENSKLREILMDRGHIVDSLQGKIAIICEDIPLTLQRLDYHIPLTKSPLSSHLLPNL